MNLHFTGEAYANAQGLSLREPGVYEIDDATAKVLLATYPQWFAVTDEQPMHIEAKVVEDGTVPALMEEEVEEITPLEDELGPELEAEKAGEAEEVVEPKTPAKSKKEPKAKQSNK